MWKFDPLHNHMFSLFTIEAVLFIIIVVVGVVMILAAAAVFLESRVRSKIEWKVHTFSYSTSCVHAFC